MSNRSERHRYALSAAGCQQIWSWALVIYLCTGPLLLTLGPSVVKADSIVTTREVAQLVRLEDVDELDGEIFGYVVNHSDQVLYRVTLLIRYHWHWRNETRPGEDDESRHESVTLTELITPGGKVRFSHRPSMPLPERDDGELLPTVSIQSVQAYEKRPMPRPTERTQVAPDAVPPVQVLPTETAQ